MKASNELYLLIRSLSKAEKRYFKLYASLQSGNKNYLRLFDAIDKQAKGNTEQDEYDEGKLMRELEGETFLRHLPVVKNYLYHLILKSLRSYRTEDSIEKYLRGAILDVRFLHEKGLHRQARKHLAKAKKTAQKHNKFLPLIELLTLEQDMNIELLDLQALEENTPANISEVKKALSSLDNLYDYKKLEAELTVENKRYMWSGKEESRQNYQEIINHPLLKDQSLALSHEAHLLYYLLNIVTLYFSEQPPSTATIQKIYRYNSKLVQLFEESEDLAREYAQRYIAVLRNQAITAHHLGKEKEVWESIGKLRHFPVKQSKIKNRAFGMYYLLSLYLHVRNADFEEGAQLLQEVNKNFPRFKSSLNKEHELSLYFSAFQLCFGTARYREALSWLRQIIEDEEYKDTREDIRTFARILEAIVYFELGERDATERSLKGLHRYFYRKGQLRKFEQLYIHFLKELAETDTQDELTVLFRMMKEQLEELKNDSAETRAFQYFNLNAWLESKIQGKPFAAIVQEQLNQTSDGQAEEEPAIE